MNEDERYIAESIQVWVWSGYYSASDIEDMLEDILEEDCDAVMLKALIEPELARKREAERGWPNRTDCDRLDGVFEQLHEVGICALGNAGYTMSDGLTEVAEAVHQGPVGHYHGYCFYHGQDVERSVQDGGLMLAFGALNDNAQDSLNIARRIVEALKAVGFEVQWDGSTQQRINLPGLHWQRRG